MTAWTLQQQAERAQWGLAELERDPAFMATVDPLDAYLAARRPAVEDRPVSSLPPAREPTPEENASRSIERRYETLRERAIIALRDPDGEADAVAPLSQRRARQILTDPDDGLMTSIAPIRVTSPGRVVMPARDGRDLLTRLGADPGRAHGMLRCPAHEDRHASLSWRLAPDGKPLLHCFAGCDFASIVAAA